MERDTFDKWEIAELFGFGIKVVERDLTEMRKHDEFSNYVYNPSKKRVCIELVGYKKTKLLKSNKGVFFSLFSSISSKIA